MSYCDIDDKPTFYKERWHKAKSTHKCCECGHIIQPGETYHRVNGMWEGFIGEYKTCEPCADLYAALPCVMHGDLHEQYANYLDDAGIDAAWSKSGDVLTKHKNRGME